MVTGVRHTLAASSSITSSNDDLGALVRRAQRGDGDAFAALVSSHDAEVRRVAQRIVRDIDDADDMTQEVWLRVTEKITQISEPDSFRAWVRSVARSVCLNFLRRKRTIELVMPARDVATDAIPVAPADEQSSSPEREVLRRDEQRKLWEALGALSERDRTVLRLRELEDRGYGDIGTTLGTSAHAAEVRGSRARDRLRRQINVVDQAKVPCNANPLRLRTLVEHRSGQTARGSGDDHVWSCPTCQHRLASMGIGRNALSGLAGFVLLPSGLMATLNHIRAAIGRGYASLGGTQIIARVPLSVPVTPALESGTSLLSGAGGMAVAAAAVLSMAVGFGSTPADAHDANPVTHVVQLLASSTRAGQQAFEDELQQDDGAAAGTVSPVEPPASIVAAGEGGPGPSASAAASVAREVEAPQPTHTPAKDPSPSPQPTSPPSGTPAPSSPAVQPSSSPTAHAVPPKAAEKAGVQAKQDSSQPPKAPNDHAARSHSNGPVPQQEPTRGNAAAHLDLDVTSRVEQDPSTDGTATAARAKEGGLSTSTQAARPASAAPQRDNDPPDHSHGPRNVMAASVTNAGASLVTAERGKAAAPSPRKG